MTREMAIAELKTRYLTMSQCLDKEDLHKANEAIDIAIRSLEMWEKVLADIEETMLHYHDWGLIEFKAQHKEEAYKEILEYLERKLLEITRIISATKK